MLVAGADGNANFDKVSVRATVETDATEEQFARLVSETERRCPVTQLFQRSGLEFDNQWQRLPLDAGWVPSAPPPGRGLTPAVQPELARS